MKIDGNRIASEIMRELKERVTPRKTLVAIVVGSDPATKKFVERKEKAALELGVRFIIEQFEKSVSTETLMDAVRSLNRQRSVGGIIVQLPLPAHINAPLVVSAVTPEKDVDVLSDTSLSRTTKVLPPPVCALIAIIRGSLVAPQGDEESLAGWYFGNKAVSVVGLGTLVGKPISAWLLGKSKELHLLDKGSDLSILKKSDVIILGTGVPHLIKNSMIAKKSLVIDFGYGKLGGSLAGDLDPERLASTVSYTPTPGGTGPILIACLLRNFYTLNG